ENKTPQTRSRAFSKMFVEQRLCPFSRDPTRARSEQQCRAASTKVYGASGARSGLQSIWGDLACKN
ncbi:uncharacterized, partial [Tachysurus ichikawai]